MALTKEEQVERSQLVRLYEANVTIAIPSELDLRFRKSLMIKLANVYVLPRSLPAPASIQRRDAKSAENQGRTK